MVIQAYVPKIIGSNLQLYIFECEEKKCQDWKFCFIHFSILVHKFSFFFFLSTINEVGIRDFFLLLLLFI